MNLFTCRFTYRHDAPFNAQTYVGFLEQIVRKYAPQKVRITHDRTSYHKDDEVGDWLREHRRHIQAHLLPPYSPEFNPMERVWHHIRLSGTHNRYFLQKLCAAIYQPDGPRTSPHPRLVARHDQ